MERVARVLVVAILTFTMYIVYTGSISTYDIVTGVIVAIAVGLLFSDLTVRNPKKLLCPTRWATLLVYALKYFFYYETIAHIDVIRRILHPRVPVNPAIVEAPFNADTDYAIAAVANSITNTPGTVVVDVDESRKVFYIHWIDAKTLDPVEVRKTVFEDFERYIKKVFD